MTFVTTFLVLAVFGIIDAGYLYYEHRNENKSLICPLDHDCAAVTESKWSTIFGVRNELLGLLFYAGVFLFALSPIVLNTDSGLVKSLLMLATTGGLIFSIFLTAVQFVSIKDYCFYCLISAAITMFLFINSFFLNYG
ncbi:MAG: hypothetical protein A2751_00660 [Candidatus Doudnabacteria bacterium RIFCSPHIGHO2_01_FULL_46_14]|uniref:Vitamin K epoxide reductase domain-containing protein n=1 Tax=Candidatus Doudnabacteria bacterium RIFCSPHIGHO2_01_FULL_46_14 TaxID=1817824 RepID=A0A1F5NN62_9BACT|nr:MAG: hypothetical protein A2751_00660 [Candidatus Doudnabacteria bacterium RIFCSPHIGHO2_01_FULL_46_14]